MANNEKRIVIRHEDGRAYSVTPAVFKTRYEPEGFTAGDRETPADFVANVPKVPTRAGARRKSTKAARPAKRPAPAAVSAEDATPREGSPDLAEA